MPISWNDQQSCGPLGMMGNSLQRVDGADKSMSNESVSGPLSSSFGSTIDAGSIVQGGPIHPSPQSNITQDRHISPQRDGTHAPSNAPTSIFSNPAIALSHEVVAGAFPPLGLSGPTNFVFSPGVINSTRSNRNRSIQQGRFLSFLSCHFSNGANLSQLGQATASGSPIRTMGSSGGGGSGERRLCVIDMGPFWDQIRHADTLLMEQGDRKINAIDSSLPLGMKYGLPITNPNVVMEEFATFLLNTSMNRSDNRGIQSNVLPKDLNGSKSATPKKSTKQSNTIQGSDSIISLEERLRRERQRLHSSGVTQFSWMNVGKLPQRQRSISPPYRSLSPQPNGNSQNGSPTRPSPEQRPFSRASRVKDISPSTPISVNDKTKCSNMDGAGLRILVPFRGNVHIQDGVGPNSLTPLRQLYNKSMLEECPSRTNIERGRKRGNFSDNSSRMAQNNRTNGSVVGRDAGAIDPQLSPDGTMAAFVVAGEIYVIPCQPPLSEDDYDNGDFERRNDFDSGAEHTSESNARSKEDTDNLSEGVRVPTRVTFGAVIDGESDDCDNVHTFTKNDGTMEDHDELPHLNPRRGSSKEKYGCSITHGLADFVAQEEMDRYRGFWWDTKSRGILFVRVDESSVPPFRIMHHGAGVQEPNYEDHRYPFAGQSNPDIMLGYVRIDRETILGNNPKNGADETEVRDKQEKQFASPPSPDSRGIDIVDSGASRMARFNWSCVKWFKPPPEASEYLTRIYWLPDGDACVQWQDRIQSTLMLVKVCIETGESLTIHKEESGVWINLHHMFKVLSRPIDPRECLYPDEFQDGQSSSTLPDGTFSFLFASERTGFCHLYLYTYTPGDEQATLIRAVSAGEWIVESITGVDMENNIVYVTGTFNSPLEKHLYALPLINPHVGGLQVEANEKTSSGMGVRRGLQNVIHSLSGGASISKAASAKFQLKDDDTFGAWAHPNPIVSTHPPDPICLTTDTGMHSIVMDESCRLIIDTSSDLTRPTSTKIYYMPLGGPFRQDNNSRATSLKLICVPYDSSLEVDTSAGGANIMSGCPAPELLSFPTSDGTETLHAALYRPDPNIHGHGPYALICAVYGGPHVQRVNRSWCQSADMRVQRWCALGFAVVKCDNRGSARRGLAFEGAIKKRLGRFEVFDQITTVRHLIMKGIADPARVGVYGWSYGGYLAAMCLCRAPGVFKVGIAGAPVTSWEGYDTHYTERYMGLPDENPKGYKEAAVFEHVPNMKGKLLIVHGLIDENVHFRHTARLINRLIAAGKDYDILIFPDERHSPRKLRDRVYMEKRMSDYFIENLQGNNSTKGLRFMPGHL